MRFTEADRAARAAIGSAMAVALAALMLSTPVAQAQEEGAAGGLPEVFTAPPPDVEMSDETVTKLRALTGVARLERMAAADAELAALKYSDPKAALAAVGAELPAEVDVSIARNDETGRDEVTVIAYGESTALRFDAEGNHVDEPRTEPASGAGAFAARCSDAACQAAMHCYGNSMPGWGAVNYCGQAGSEVCTAWRWADGTAYHVPCSSY